MLAKLPDRPAFERLAAGAARTSRSLDGEGVMGKYRVGNRFYVVDVALAEAPVMRGTSVALARGGDAASRTRELRAFNRHGRSVDQSLSILAVTLIIRFT